jgi:predicted ATPase
MRVYFSGAHGTGKSTLARYISEKYNLPLLTEVARMVLSEQELQVDSLRYDLKTVDNYQKAIFKRQLEEENKLSNFVADRSLIDCLSYSAEHSRILPDLMAEPALEDYLAKLAEPDSILFFVRPSKATLHADGVRESINWDGIISIDSQIKMMLQMWKIPHFQINMSNMVERVTLIDNVLSLAR